MAFVIAVYDVEQRTCAKMLRLFRQYLTWVQNSVFEGELTESQERELTERARALLAQTGDSVILYSLGNERYVRRECIGAPRPESGRFL